MTDPLKDDALDALFATARADTPAPSEALMAAIMGDAAEAMPRRAGTPPAGGVWAGMLGALGGWAGVGGLAAATVAGLWIGVAPPDGLTSLAATLAGDNLTVTLYPDSGADVLGADG